MSAGSLVHTVTLMALEQDNLRKPTIAIIAISPAVLSAGFLLHPFIGAGKPDQAAIARAAHGHMTQWGVAHLMVAVSSALLILAFLSIRVWLRAANNEVWSARGVPFVVLGSTLYALLPAMEMAPLFAAKAGVDVEAVARALVPWFIPIIISSSITYFLGVGMFACGIADSRLLSPVVTRVVVVGLVVSAVSRFVPITAVQFYVQSAASLAAFWTLAASISPSATAISSQRAVATADIGQA